MYPGINTGQLSSNLAIYENWAQVRATAALKAFTTVKKMITEKKIVYDNGRLFLMMSLPMEVMPVMYRKNQRK